MKRNTAMESNKTSIENIIETLLEVGVCVVIAVAPLGGIVALGMFSNIIGA